MSAISDLFSRLFVDQSVRICAHEVFPLIKQPLASDNSTHLSTPYLLLPDAPESGAVRVEEVSPVFHEFPGMTKSRPSRIFQRRMMWVWGLSLSQWLTATHSSRIENVARLQPC